MQNSRFEKLLVSRHLETRGIFAWNPCDPTNDRLASQSHIANIINPMLMNITDSLGITVPICFHCLNEKQWRLEHQGYAGLDEDLCQRKSDKSFVNWTRA